MGTPKSRWLEIVSTFASEYYDQEEEHGEASFSKEDIDADETGDALNDIVADFALWLSEGGYK